MSSPTNEEIERAARRASTGSVARALTILDELTAGAHGDVRPQIAVAFYRELWAVTPHGHGNDAGRTAQEQAGDLFAQEQADETQARTYRLAALEALSRGDSRGAQLLATLAASAASTDLAVLVRKMMLVEHPHFAALRTVIG
jgi:hypothetical protein